MMLLLGLALLLAGGTFLVSGASHMATRIGVSPLVVGLTVVAFGTSAPELFVNVLGALRNETALAFGNVAGSNLANLALVLGTAALFSPVAIQGQIVRRELPLLMLATCILAVMTLDRVLQGGESLLSRSDGLVLLLLFSIFLYISIGDFLVDRDDPLVENLREMRDKMPEREIPSLGKDWILILVGTAGLGLGGHFTVEHGSALAASLGVSPAVIGLLIVAIGTSLPELVTSIIASLRNEPDLCVGNVVGSNIFNSLVVLPISAMVRPIPIPDYGLLDILISLAVAIAIVPIFLYGRARMGRPLGSLFIIVYVVYMVFRVTTG